MLKELKTGEFEDIENAFQDMHRKGWMKHENIDKDSQYCLWLLRLAYSRYLGFYLDWTGLFDAQGFNYHHHHNMVVNNICEFAPGF